MEAIWRDSRVCALIRLIRLRRKSAEEVVLASVTEGKPRVDHLLAFYEKMVEIRKFELKVQELFRSGLLPGFVHLYIGEEAVATAACSALEPDDLIFSTHRGHGHALAKGVPARFLLAELWGKTTGCCGGRGGSMHVYAPEYGLMGTNGVVGAPIPLATGAALSARVRRTNQVVLCFFGDGAVNTGSFHESLNLAAVWDLPVVYICENNQFATEMAFSRATKNTSVSSRAAAYGMPAAEVDGNDVIEVHDAARLAVARARSGEGPTLMECETYRIVGHHEGDPGTGYRTKEEVQEWKRRCPVAGFRRVLLEDYRIDEKTLADIDEKIDGVIEDAVEFARMSPEPSAAGVLEEVF
jgi:pyruvate dehydrogenase E1 component alpha subunit